MTLLYFCNGFYVIIKPDERQFNILAGVKNTKKIQNTTNKQNIFRS